ncbi:MAG: ANTAR domain-containing protein [Pseudotabrizicola sp.]|uniref:ANTAR domain-containing response regulator n=1 Tax=Pseudotabrizicola sp. TaxID=2939647 RepID=UPI0027214A5E|nr:ANTAR domain-containing protein [Pseudotabrizicola sp.]MDO9640784.1 ANTAR domain-containing protein [Pseudotabrizicola sp.]
MSRIIHKNFRGLRALLVMGPNTAREGLESALVKLGLTVEMSEMAPCPRETSVNHDLVFFDADDGAEPSLEGIALPLVALVGSEAPSRLARVVRYRAASHILKPLRSSGVFLAVFLAVNEHNHRSRLEQETQSLRRRLAGRRTVIQAVLSLMGHGLTEDEAYERLRREAMERRIPIEDMARLVLSIAPDAGPEKLRAIDPIRLGLKNPVSPNIWADNQQRRQKK